MIGCHADILEDERADEKVRLIGKRIEGRADTRRICRRIEAVEQVNVGRGNGCGSERGAQEAHMGQFIRSDFGAVLRKSGGLKRNLRVALDGNRSCPVPRSVSDQPAAGEGA